MRKFAWVSAGMIAGLGLVFVGCSGDSGSDDAGGDGDGDVGDGDAGDGDAGDGDAGDGDVGDGDAGDGDVGDGDVGDGDTGDGDVGDGDPLHGAFIIRLTAETEGGENEAFTSFQGNVRTSELVESIEWEFVREEGECQLFVPAFPFCDPECESGSVCVAGDVCVPEARPVNIGPVTVSGATTQEGATEFTVSPIGSKSNYLTTASNSLAYPPAEDGAPITLTGEIEGSELSLTSYGISPLSVGASEYPIGGSDAVVTWDPPANAAESEMEIRLEISHHGGVKGEVTCWTEDDGEHTIPASIQDDLIDLGVAGFPTITFRRVARGVSVAPHEIELRVEQYVQIPVVIDGLVSCTTDDDCEDGLACQVDRSCR